MTIKSCTRRKRSIPHVVVWSLGMAGPLLVISYLFKTWPRFRYVFIFNKSFRMSKIINNELRVACETTVCWRVLSYGIWRRVVWFKFTEFWEECAASRRGSTARRKQNAELCFVNNAGSRSCPGVGGSCRECCRRRTTRLEGVVMALKIWKTFGCWVMATTLKRGRASTIRDSCD
jgi:hypothetical protein